MAGCRVYMTGSTATRLFLPGASIDVLLVRKDATPKSLFKQVREALVNCDGFEVLDTYKSTKTPMLKILSTSSGLVIDIGFNDPSGLVWVRETLKAVQALPEIPYLLFVLKIFLRQRKINNAYTGGLGSTLLLVLLVHFLREYRDKFTWRHGAEEAGNLSLGQMLLQFLQYYGTDFSFRDMQIKLGEKEAVQKKPEPSFSLNVFVRVGGEAEVDLGVACTKFSDISRIFKNRYSLLSNTAQRPGESVLAPLINPQGNDFAEFLK